MKALIVLAFAGALGVAAPAFAQDAGQPGATGTGGGLTGSNTGTGGATMMSGHSKHEGGMMMMHHHRHWRRHHHHYHHHM